MENNEKIILTLTLEYKKFKSQFYGLNLKIKTALENGFRFNQIVKLTIKNVSSLSNINICYCFKFLIPMMHREHFRIISQKPKNVETHCNDLNNPFHFACRRWMINQ